MANFRAAIQVHPGLSRANSLKEAAAEYGKSTIARAACDGNVAALLAALETDPDAMFEPNPMGQVLGPHPCPRLVFCSLSSSLIIFFFLRCGGV
jgi:hypothetical protein